MQALAPARRLIEELPPPPETPQLQDIPFLGRPLLFNLPFAASQASLTVVGQLSHGIAQLRRQEADARAALNAATNQRRCARQPLIGQDTVRALRAPR